jgi:DNA-directed RNA polymerase I, II, and III subunit RPABC1
MSQFLTAKLIGGKNEIEEKVKTVTKNLKFEMTDVERHHSALKTVTSMLIRRRWVNYTFEDELQTMVENEDFNKCYDELIKNSNELLDTTFIQCIDKKVAVKFYYSKLNTLKNDREIDNFISEFPDCHKILIANDISPKAEKQIMDSLAIEVFKIMEVVRDISKHDLVPTHILLSKEDADKFMSEYKLGKQDMGRIFIDDPMARFLYAQKDGIIQIRRSTLSSGISTYYRLVVAGTVKN